MKTIDRIGAEERAYLEEVVDYGFRTSCNYKVTKRLEDEFAAKFGVKYAVAFCNGTATLHAALEAAGVGEGDEVIVPPLTMSSTTFGVLHANATPVFADIDPDTFEISAAAIERAITPRTKAIIPVALFGLAPDMEAIMQIAKAHDLVVIEDDAQCFLGRQKDKLVGSWGDMASFSFQSSKHLTSGEGGMVITDNEALAAAIRRVSGLGYAGVSPKKGRISKADIQDPNYDRHVSMGWNYRISDLCSAVALGQLHRLDELVTYRTESAMRHDAILSKATWLKKQTVGADMVHAWWAYPVLLTAQSFSWKDVYNKYVEFGGPGFYSAWKLTYQEPFWQNKQFAGRERYIPAYRDLVPVKNGLCPHAEAIQPRLMLFKTNYFDGQELDRDMEALEKTVEYFNRKK